MVYHDSDETLLSLSEINQLRDRMAPLDYSRGNIEGSEVLVIRTASEYVDIVDDLETMVEIFNLDDLMDLDRVYLISGEDHKLIPPEILGEIAVERERCEKEYIKFYSPILDKPYITKEFIDEEDTFSLIRLMIRVPLTSSEFQNQPIENILNNMYHIAEDVSLFYFLLDDGYLRLSRDDIFSTSDEEPKGKGKADVQSSPRDVPREAEPPIETRKVDFEMPAPVKELDTIESASILGTIDELAKAVPEDSIDKSARGVDITQALMKIPISQLSALQNIDFSKIPLPMLDEQNFGFPKYTHKNVGSEKALEQKLDSHASDSYGKIETISKSEPPIQDILSNLEPLMDHSRGERKGWMEETYGGSTENKDIYEMIKEHMPGINVMYLDTGDENDLVLKAQLRDGSRILVGWVERCKLNDIKHLEDLVDKYHTSLGVMISKKFNYATMLYIVGKDLDIVEWDKFKQEGIPGID